MNRFALSLFLLPVASLFAEDAFILHNDSPPSSVVKKEKRRGKPFIINGPDYVSFKDAPPPKKRPAKPELIASIQESARSHIPDASPISVKEEEMDPNDVISVSTVIDLMIAAEIANEAKEEAAEYVAVAEGVRTDSALPKNPTKRAAYLESEEYRKMEPRQPLAAQSPAAPPPKRNKKKPAPAAKVKEPPVILAQSDPEEEAPVTQVKEPPVVLAQSDPGERKSFLQRIFGKKRSSSPSSPPPPPIATGPDLWDPYPWPKRVDIRHVIGNQEKDCIPFATNFTTLAILFAPDYRLGHVLPLVDLRAHRFDNNTYATNVGVGGRYIPKGDSGFCEMLGFNVYYDYRQGCIGYYQQLSAGIEVLSKRWDFRANAYFPFGRRRHIHKCVFDDYDGDFFAIRRDIESVSYSFNGEVGYPAVRAGDFLLYIAAGPYFLVRGKCNNGTPGGEVRLHPQYKDYLALDLSYRYDDLFGAIWQAEVIFSLPLYQISGRNKRPCGISDRQIYQPIERFEVMPLSKKTCWHSNF